MDEAMNGSENEPATRGDLKVLREDIVTALRSEMRDLFRPIVATLANHTAELAEIRSHIKDKMVTREEFHSRMDGFTRRVDDFDYSSAKNRFRLDEHENRIGALEKKSS